VFILVLWTEARTVVLQNDWVFGLFPSSGILGTRKHDISENWIFSVLRCRGDTYSLGSLRHSYPHSLELEPFEDVSSNSGVAELLLQE
jgi:hypothetical protein